MVKPSANEREAPYIERAIEMTRQAYGLDDIEYIDYAQQTTGEEGDDNEVVDPEVVLAELRNDTETIPNARLLDPNVLSDTFTARQQIRNVYGFPDKLDVDRYTIDGTTRDYVEATIAVGPWAGTLVDTAGLRDSHEPIERAGVERSVAQLQGADVVLWVEAADEPDAGAPTDVSGEVLRIESKRDRGTRRVDWIGVSTPPQAEAHGVSDVREALARWFRSGADSAWIGLSRHRDRAAEAAVALADARTRLVDDTVLELAAVALAEAQGRLGEITGRGTAGPIGAEVLDRIFARFCIGK